MEDKDQKCLAKKECKHDWEAIEKTTGPYTYLEVRCKKCGEKKEIELFP